jgi:hypothetical protein
MKRYAWLAWAISVILALTFGIFVGHSITAAYKDVEIMNAQAALEAAKKETAWWQGVLTRLAEGEQLKDMEEER